MDTEPQLGRFVRFLETAIAEQYERGRTSHDAMAHAMLPGFQELLGAFDPQPWLDDRAGGLPVGGRTRALLHHSPGAGFTVWLTAFVPGYQTAIHDHGTWGLVGVLTGCEQEERFSWQDHPSGGELALVGRVTNQQGDVSLLIPPDDVHRISNESSALALSLHVYARRHLTESSYIYLERGTRFPVSRPEAPRERLDMPGFESEEAPLYPDELFGD